MVKIALLGLLAGCFGTEESFFAQDVVDEHLDVAYVPGSDDPRQHLDYFLPRGTSDYPIVVFIHGGFWIHQSKDYVQPVLGLYRNVGIALAKRGIATAVIDYRLAPSVSFDTLLGDCATAIAWVQANVQKQRMVIAGHSAGGHLTALAAFDEARLGIDVSDIVGYAPLSPILDIQAMADTDSDYADIAHEVFGDAFAENSPTTFFKQAVKPVHFLLGGDDERFIMAQVQSAVPQLQALGAPVALDVIPGHTHTDMVLDFDGGDDQVSPLLAAFVEQVTSGR